MSRTNPRVEELEYQNKILREDLKRLRADPGDCPLLACDNSCVCARPTGMATNGGCRCDERKLQQAVQWWRRKALFLEETIREMKNGDYDSKS
jgi:hypothetical protein